MKDSKAIELLKQDLAKAIREKNTVRIEELKTLLNISSEQEKYFDKGLTGYPSIDKVWLNYYRDGAEDLANNIPVDKTVWDVIEEKLIEYYDIPAIEYFGRIFSKKEFIDLCYVWARTFRAMGVAPGEVVPVYGPFVPDICAMVFALNMIGAVPYFLKLAISDEALAEETKEAKIAVVFDGMWGNVAKEFSKDKFKNVIVASVTMDMPSPKKEIVSFLSKIQAMKNKTQIPDEKKYIWADKAREIANYYSGNVKVPFEANRPTFITSSSGTTVGGVVKGTVATNESTISQLYMGMASDIQYFPGDTCLNHFPPTASTSLNVLFLLPLFNGMKVYVDPRVSEKDFYNQIVNLKPNMALTTGSAWEAFFNRVEKEMSEGKKFDFSYAKGWTVGGEGTDVRKFLRWDEIMKQAHAYNLLFSGYGSSELFSATSVETVNARYDFSKQIMSVGIPYAGITMGVFDEDGNELSYGQRGELRIKSMSAMKEYYNKPGLTLETKVDGWIKTGDLSEIDEKGFIYIWGRKSDKLKNCNIYLFDVANKIKDKEYIDDAIVLPKPTDLCEDNLVAHIVWDKSVLDDDKDIYLKELTQLMKEYLPNGYELNTFTEHKGMLPYSPTTLKKDRKRMAEQNVGFVQVIDDKVENVEYIPLHNGQYCVIAATDEKVKKLQKK